MDLPNYNSILCLLELNSFYAVIRVEAVKNGFNVISQICIKICSSMITFGNSDQFLY